MIDEIKKLVDQYIAWLGDNTHLKELRKWVEITTPFLDRHNDFIQIYTRKMKNGYLLTDDSHTIADLELCGCELKTPKRKHLLDIILNGFGVNLNHNALEISATQNDFPLRKHSLVQAILAVNDMFCLAAPTVANLFYEDVVSWLDENNVRYSPRVKFPGKSRFDHIFDFVIPKYKKHPERLIQVVSNPDRRSAQSVAFSWVDVKGNRPKNAKAFAFLNNRERPVPISVLEALRNYDVTPITWEKRNEFTEELVA